MKFILLFLAFFHLSIAAITESDADKQRFCSEACPYLKTLNKDPKAKISIKELEEKCKTDPNVPKYICDDTDKPDRKTLKLVERVTWTQVCKVICGN